MNNPSVLLGLALSLSVSGPLEMSVPKTLRKSLKSFEPSAVIYIEQRGQYLISSDDTTKSNDPWLFLMDDDGSVSPKPVVIEGVERMTDIESLSQDSGFIYAMSSQSRNKKGKVLEDRNLFVRGKLVGQNIKETEVVELRSGLIEVLKGLSDLRLRAVRSELEERLEIEASFVKAGVVYVGLKEPQTSEGKGLLLSLGSADEIFSEGQLNPAKVRVITEIDFTESGAGQEKISDIAPLEDGRFLVTATLEDGGGSVWQFDGRKVELLKEYETERPEGITVGKDEEVMVVFDQSEEAGLFSKLD
jgi:hypothetical protein